ncbi:YecR family lipoprotein [Pseudomonas moraviensis]|uniref:YecR family lipoprotein n=1 Tax=Pseudomonas moraviensis TaxID=321662 RepID=UPI0010597B2D|nr:YecR family lipoprotein [Pseudomonas moraviensis]TDK55514.1 hypothetical protein E1508_08590 [Pseudomonas moraviensis]
MKSLIATLTLSALFLTGCATPKQWEATGGSKTDGIVQVSYELGQFESGQTNAEQGLTIATQRCKTWGYNTAEITGSEKNICRTMGKFNCLQTTITQDYLCKR